MFRVAMSSRIGWTPRTFWHATALEMEMAIDGAQGRFRPGPFISRDRVAEIARAHGRRQSIRGKAHQPRPAEKGER